MHNHLINGKMDSAVGGFFHSEEGQGTNCICEILLDILLHHCNRRSQIYNGATEYPIESPIVLITLSDFKNFQQMAENLRGLIDFIALIQESPNAKMEFPFKAYVLIFRM
jgi:hypothetical protein